MSEERLYTLLSPSEGMLKDRGSKFFAYAYPVKEPAEVEALLGALRKQHHDARHHCTAYRLGLEGETVYVNDDGEPGNSAGAPILAAIRSASLTNVAIIVVRYFGGTKLGIRGLIEAYRGAAEEAIAHAEIQEIAPKRIFTLFFPYAQTSEVNRILHRFEVEEVAASYTDTCERTLSILDEAFPALQSQLEQARIEVRVERLIEY